MAILFADGFESGNFNAWSVVTGSPVVVSNPVKSGVYAMESDASGDYVRYAFTDNIEPLFFRWYTRISALPATGQGVENAKVFGDAADVALVSLWKTAGVMGINLEYWFPAYTSVFAPYPFLPNQWYCIELMVKVGSVANGEYRVWVNGTEVHTITGVNTSVRPDLDALFIGSLTDNYVVVTHTDAVVISDSYIGPKVERRVTPDRTENSTSNLVCTGQGARVRTARHTDSVAPWNL